MHRFPQAVAVAAAVLAVLAAACSETASPLGAPPATARPSAAPTAAVPISTSPPGPVASPVPARASTAPSPPASPVATSTQQPAGEVPAVPSSRDELDPGLLVVPACNSRPAGEREAGGGTVPRPTPTSAPVGGATPPSDSGAGVGSYLALAAPVLEYAAHWLESLDLRWPPAATPENQEDDQWVSMTARNAAALLRETGVRLAAACAATAILPSPPRARAAKQALITALEAHDAWARSAATALRRGDSPGASTLESAPPAAASAFTHAIRAHDDLRQSAPIDSSSDAGPIQVENERARSSLPLLPGWLVAETAFRTVLIAPPDLQLPGLDGLGPDPVASNAPGVTITARRLRNPPGHSLAAAVDRALAALQPGDIVQETRAAQVDGSEGRELVIDHGQLGHTQWRTRLILVVAGQHTFFLSIECPAPLDTECAGAFQATLRGARLFP